MKWLRWRIHDRNQDTSDGWDTCYADWLWDLRIRDFCSANELVYQGFSLLTANRSAMTHPEMVKIAKRHGRTVSQIVFRFALDVGMMPLTGTSDSAHMREDLDIFGFHLDPEEIKRIETVGRR